MAGKNTISSSKRRKGADKRFAPKAAKGDGRGLPTPVTISVKPHHQTLIIKIAAAVALVFLVFVIANSIRRRSVRRQALLDELDKDRLLASDDERQGEGGASLLDDAVKNESVSVHSVAQRTQDTGGGEAHSSEHHEEHHSEHRPEHREEHHSEHRDEHRSESHSEHHSDHHDRQPVEHHHDSPSSDHHSHRSEHSFDRHHEAHVQASHAPHHHHQVYHTSAPHAEHPDAPQHAHSELHAVQHTSAPNAEHHARARGHSEHADGAGAGAVAGLPIKSFHSAMEWYARDDLKNGGKPLCRISKPCMLSNGMIAVPSWMEKQEAVLARCGLGPHVFYDEGIKPPGVKYLTEIGADFALTIQPKKFQEPTHFLSVFFTEHIMKSSFLFDTFAGQAKYPDGIKVSHCIATESGTDCSTDGKPEKQFQPALFIPKRMQLGKANAWGMRLVDMFGRAHSHDRHTVHLNLSTMLVPAHKDHHDGLSGTCFRSILTADAMFRHFPPMAMVNSKLFSSINGIHRDDRQRMKDGKCTLNIGIFDLKEGPKGIIGLDDFKSSVEQFAKLALPEANVNVVPIEISPDTPLDDHIKEIQALDVFIAGSGDEMSSLAFLRGSATVYEILQFGLNPDTHQSLAESIGIQYTKLHSKPSTAVFKACMETQMANLRKKGKLEEGVNPPWWDDLMSTWESAVAEYTLSGKTELDLLTNHTAIANFDSRHCAKMQSLVFNHEDAARAIIVDAKGLCGSA